MSTDVPSLVAEFGERLLALHDKGDPIGRRRISQLLTQWSGRKVTEWKARRIREALGLEPIPSGRLSSRLNDRPMRGGDTGYLMEDEQTSPTTREISVRSERIKTLEDLLEAAGIDERSDWVVTHWKANAWEAMSKGEDGRPEVITLHQVKASLSKSLRAAHRPAQPQIKIKHTPRPPRKDGIKRALFIPDSQVGYRWRNRYTYLEPLHDRLAFDACIQLAGQPEGWDVVFLLGDMADLGEWSRKFSTDPSLKQTTQPTIDELHWWLARLRAAVGEHCRIIYLAGNHEERATRRLVDDIPEAVGLTAAGEKMGSLHMARLLRLDELDIEWVGPYGADYWLWGSIRVTHGQTVRQGGGATSAAVLKGASWSEVFGHIHRLEYAEKTLHGPEGRRVISAMSPGCLCRLEPGVVPGFKQRQDWQTGVGVAWLDEMDEAHMAAIPIRDGRLIWSDGILQGEDRAAEIAKQTGWSQMDPGGERED